MERNKMYKTYLGKQYTKTFKIEQSRTQRNVSVNAYIKKEERASQ